MSDSEFNEMAAVTLANVAKKQSDIAFKIPTDEFKKILSYKKEDFLQDKERALKTISKKSKAARIATINNSVKINVKPQVSQLTTFV